MKQIFHAIKQNDGNYIFRISKNFGMDIATDVCDDKFIEQEIDVNSVRYNFYWVKKENVNSFYKLYYVMIKYYLHYQFNSLFENCPPEEEDFYMFKKICEQLHWKFIRDENWKKACNRGKDIIEKSIYRVLDECWMVNPCANPVPMEKYCFVGGGYIIIKFLRGRCYTEEQLDTTGYKYKKVGDYVIINGEVLGVGLGEHPEALPFGT